MIFFKRLINMNKCQNCEVDQSITRKCKIESVHLKWVEGSKNEYLYLVNAC